MSCGRSDQQPAGHTDDPGGRHPGPGQRAQPPQGQGGAAGGGERGHAHAGPGAGRAAEAADPVFREGLWLCMRITHRARESDE